MKIAVLLILASFLQPNYLLEKKRVGSIEVGSNVEDIYQYFDKDLETELVDRYLEATFSPAIVVKNNEDILFIANLDCNIIYSIEVLHYKYKTERGMRVGMTYKSLKERHNVSSILKGEGRLFAIVDDLNMSFALETTEVLNSGLDLNTNFNPDDIPNGITISSIIVY